MMVMMVMTMVMVSEGMGMGCHEYIRSRRIVHNEPDRGVGPEVMHVHTGVELEITFQGL